MSFTRIARLGAVVCLLTASAVEADAGQDRARRRGGDSGAVAQRRAVPRSPAVTRRHVAPPVVRVAPPSHRLGYHAAYRPVYRPAYRPMYRPGLGIGIYIGAPFAYRYPAYGRRYYAAPYPYAYPYASPYAYGYPGYPYPTTTDIYAAPPQGALYGGVRLDVTPRDAAVYVDGYYAGIVDDFDGAMQRIALEPGPHRFEIEAPGHETLTFEVNIQPNQTVRYHGDMRLIP